MSKSFGITLGRGLGIAGALLVEGAVRGAHGAGQFGKDVVEGAETGYAERHAELVVKREIAYAAAKAAREARIAEHKAAQQALTMVPATAKASRAKA